MAEDIRNLPPSYDKPSPVDIQIMQSMFGNSVLTYELRRLVVPTVAFVILNIYAVDEFIKNLTSNQSDIIHLLIKIGIFVGIIVVAQLLGWA